MHVAEEVIDFAGGATDGPLAGRGYNPAFETQSPEREFFTFSA